ncbi:putative DNA binding domain-containing protein [Methylobacterium sp. J-026]|uniref:ATP-binding protein n=1 Tax=Methylobacterium sp. J-026 TaxID=2836624 RepID=UPI001FBB65A6|nr:ATP-binding protein [Methylobacterium sp. J-026]MCJ2138383.1 putative DNA binding domain-containing protein [Methylobacterium sp. J-026]
MVNDPQALLRRLVKEPSESAWVEFKENNDDPDMIGSWVSACANAAILAGKERGFLVFGVKEKPRRLVGTKVNLANMKKGGENFTNWLTRLIEPRLMMEFLDFKIGPLKYAIIAVEPTYDRPVKFNGVEYLRIGENTKKLAEFPNHERSIWVATGRRKFEDAIAVSHQSQFDVLDQLDVDAFYALLKEQKPRVPEEILRKFEMSGFVRDDMEGSYDITNLGAIVLAKDLHRFPSMSGKAIRVIQYKGEDKRQSENEEEFNCGYAVALPRVLRHMNSILPKTEAYTNGVRNVIPLYPVTALREIIANSMIHQDFTISGSAPIVEVYGKRVEISNPGSSLVEIDRIIDERRSRNEKLASSMRLLGLCEERGGGLDKAGFEIEEQNLPAPEFISSKDTMRVVLYGPKSFSELNKTEKLRACFFHCILRWLQRDYMSNTTLRDRFRLEQENYQAVSAIISESVKRKRIVPAETNQGKRNAKYVPYWTRKLSQ